MTFVQSSRYRLLTSRGVSPDATNQSSLEWIEKSLFVLCLDDFVSPTQTTTRTGYRNSIQMAKMDLFYMAAMLLHGGGSTLHTPNRWLDKFLQVGGGTLPR